MTDQEAANFAQGLYDTIFNSLTSSPSGQAAFDPNKTYLVMQKPGIFLSATDFANPWTPGNPNGSFDSAGNMWDLLNHEPNFASLQEDQAGSGRLISDMYKDILRSTVTLVDKQDPAVKKQYDDAYNVLWTAGKDENGNDAVFQSSAWLNYNTNQAAWITAQSAYAAAYQAAMATPATKAQWPILAPALQLPVKQAYDLWRSSGADKIEAAIAILNTSGGSQVARAFNDAQKVFDSYGQALTGETVTQQRSSISPSNWYMASAQSKWGQTHWKHNTSVYNSSSDFTSGGGGASVSLGLWSVGGGAQHSSQHFHSDASLNAIDVSYRFCVLQANRPWLNETLFNYPGWKNDAYPKGKLSAGARNSGQKNALFPLVPHAAIVIKDLIINADFSKQEIDRASSQTSASASVGWGPFSISGNYSHSHSSAYAKGEFAPGHIAQPAMQIIGWICQLNPMMPPL